LYCETQKETCNSHVDGSQLRAFAATCYGNPSAFMTAHMIPYVVGISNRSGTTGFTSNTAFSKSSVTFGPVVLPICVISASFCSVSFSACSSACLLPEVCYTWN
jgi:hypothetical protein